MSKPFLSTHQRGNQQGDDSRSQTAQHPLLTILGDGDIHLDPFEGVSKGDAVRLDLDTADGDLDGAQGLGPGGVEVGTFFEEVLERSQVRQKAASERRRRVRE